MSDSVSTNAFGVPVVPTPAPVPPSMQEDIAAVQPLLNDAAKAVPIVKSVVADIKAGGMTAALKDLPQITQEAEVLYADVKAALPTIKAGFKTSEFWIVFGVLGAIAGFSAAGHPLPIEADAIMGVVASVYAAVRALVKKNAPAAQ